MQICLTPIPGKSENRNGWQHLRKYGQMSRKMDLIFLYGRLYQPFVKVPNIPVLYQREQQYYSGALCDPVLPGLIDKINTAPNSWTAEFTPANHIFC